MDTDTSYRCGMNPLRAPSVYEVISGRGARRHSYVIKVDQRGQQAWARVLATPSRTLIDAAEGVERLDLADLAGVSARRNDKLLLAGSLNSSYLNGSVQRLAHVDVVFVEIDYGGTIQAAKRFRRGPIPPVDQLQPSLRVHALGARPDGSVVAAGEFGFGARQYGLAFVPDL